MIFNTWIVKYEIFSKTTTLKDFHLLVILKPTMWGLIAQLHFQMNVSCWGNYAPPLCLLGQSFLFN